MFKVAELVRVSYLNFLQLKMRQNSNESITNEVSSKIITMIIHNSFLKFLNLIKFSNMPPA